MIYYCDSSAVVKIYIDETGSKYIRYLSHKAPIGDIFINTISGPEVLSALHRRFRSDDLAPGVFTQACTDFVEDFEKFYNRIPASDQIILLAMRVINKHPLRGSDSVQLATALHLQTILRAFNGQEVHFISSDKVLNIAARSEGLFVINPSEQA